MQARLEEWRTRWNVGIYEYKGEVLVVREASYGLLQAYDAAIVASIDPTAPIPDADPIDSAYLELLIQSPHRSKEIWSRYWCYGVPQLHPIARTDPNTDSERVLVDPYNPPTILPEDQRRAERAILRSCLLWPTLQEINQMFLEYRQVALWCIRKHSGHLDAESYHRHKHFLSGTMEGVQLINICTVFPGVTPAEIDDWTREQFVKTAALAEHLLELQQEQTDPVAAKRRKREEMRARREMRGDDDLTPVPVTG